MQHLEQYFGVPLFTRGKNRIELNETGKLAVAAARKLLHMLHGRCEHPAVLPWTLEERQSTAAEFKIV